LADRAVSMLFTFVQSECVETPRRSGLSTVQEVLDSTALRHPRVVSCLVAQASERLGLQAKGAVETPK
jgi:hypothetical protein